MQDELKKEENGSLYMGQRLDSEEQKKSGRGFLCNEETGKIEIGYFNDDKFTGEGVTIWVEKDFVNKGGLWIDKWDDGTIHQAIFTWSNMILYYEEYAIDDE